MRAFVAPCFAFAAKTKQDYITGQTKQTYIYSNAMQKQTYIYSNAMQKQTYIYKYVFCQGSLNRSKSPGSDWSKSQPPCQRHLSKRPDLGTLSHNF